MLQRVKEVQESDLRMSGSLARNIQRVIAVTQAQIDAAAAQGKAWVVKPVVKVSDPIDNLRGGTQLVIKQNAILPGQNVMRVMYVGGQAVVVGPGTSPLSLPDAMADDILSLTAFGGIQQNGVPQEYTRLDRLQGDGTAYIDLGITLNQDDEIEVDFIFKYVSGGQIFGYRDGASARNITLFSGGGAGSLFMDFNNSDYTNYRLGTTGTDDAQYTAKISKTKRALYSGTTEIAANNTACPDTFTTGNALLFFAGGSPSGTAKFTGSILGVRIKDRMNLVPAKRNSDDVLGMYDMITGQFFTNAAGSGAFIAGDPMTPTPDYPMDIVCNNGALKARHQSGLPLGYTLLDYIEATGTQYIDTGFTPNQDTSAMLDAQFLNYDSGTQGILFGARTSSTENIFNIQRLTAGNWNMGYNNSNFNVGTADTNRHVFYKNKQYQYLDGVLKGTGTYSAFTCPGTAVLFGTNNSGTKYATAFPAKVWSFKMWDNGTLIRNLVPAQYGSNVGMYDLVNGVFYQNAGTGDFTAGDPVSDPVEIYTDGTVETIAIKDDQNATVSTATCEDLLSIGTYTDEQEVISGVVTRNVGVKVLDGTENWTYSEPNTYGIANITGTITGKVGGNKNELICSHFEPQTSAWSSTSTEGILNGNNNNQVFFRVLGTRIPNLTAWTQWLADQYNAGTPVIVIYPLATPTTESVAGQPMETAEGDCTAEITQAGMAGLELQVEYIAE